MAIHITTPAEFQAINDDLTEDYILDNDLDMTGFDLKPISIDAGNNYIDFFSGTFDGQGFTIRNVSFDDSAGQFSGVGLFYDVETGAVIQNLNIDNITIAGYRLIGGLISYAQECTVTNCHITNLAIDFVQLGFNISSAIAGLISNGYGVTVTNCSVTGVITSDSDAFKGQIAGLIGLLDEQSPTESTVEDCYADVDITLSNENVNISIRQIGALIGSARSSNIIDSYATGTLTIATNNNNSNINDIGGLIGDTEDCVLSGCYSTGPIIAEIQGVLGGASEGSETSFSGIGGLIGTADVTTTVNKSYSTSVISCVSDNGIALAIGGFIGYLAGTGTEVVNCYARGNVTFESSVDYRYGGTAKGVGIAGFVGELWASSLVKNCYATGNVSATAQSLVGGFAGQVANHNDIAIINCFSVGVVTADGKTVGGFIGSLNPYTKSGSVFTPINYVDWEIENCAVFTGANTFAVGISCPEWSATVTYGNGPGVWYDDSVDFGSIYGSIQNANLNNNPESTPLYWTLIYSQSREQLDTVNFGVDEEDNTLLYHKEHVVFDQGNPDAWDFESGTIWFERFACNDYPTFEPCGDDEEEEVEFDGSDLCPYVAGGEVRKYTSTITGLHHLEGETIVIVADGRRVDDKTVTNGTITLDEPACIVQLGFRYRGIVIPFNLVVTDQLQNSISFSKNVSTIALLLSHTLGLKYGTSLYNLQEIPEEELGQVSGTPLKPFTGVVSLPNDDEWTIDKEIICVQDQPYPALLNAMNVTIEVGEK